jgi:signal recognition particle receptor subunit beta
MPLINHSKGEINAKLVVAGPASSGKTTNLRYIYSKLKEASRGTFKTMNLQDDRMLFFDFIPSGQGSVHGYTLRFHVYTMGGDVTHPSSWKMVLKGADGLLFVADSGPDRMAANVASLKNVQASLAAYGKSMSDIPCVIQCNKRDVPEASGLEEMGLLLNAGECPVVPAVAGKGEGVLESLFALVKIVLKGFRASGLELKGEPEQFQRITESPLPERSGAPPGETGAPPEAATVPSEPPPFADASAPDSGDELVLGVAGGPEVLDGGEVRLPISITCGGKTRRMTLTVSLAPDKD